jgi:hypothetical protein
MYHSQTKVSGKEELLEEESITKLLKSDCVVFTRSAISIDADREAGQNREVDYFHVFLCAKTLIVERIITYNFKAGTQVNYAPQSLVQPNRRRVTHVINGERERDFARLITFLFRTGDNVRTCWQIQST